MRDRRRPDPGRLVPVRRGLPRRVAAEGLVRAAHRDRPPAAVGRGRPGRRSTGSTCSLPSCTACSTSRVARRPTLATVAALLRDWAVDRRPEVIGRPACLPRPGRDVRAAGPDRPRHRRRARAGRRRQPSRSTTPSVRSWSAPGCCRRRCSQSPPTRWCPDHTHSLASLDDVDLGAGPGGRRRTDVRRRRLGARCRRRRSVRRPRRAERSRRRRPPAVPAGRRHPPARR